MSDNETITIPGSKAPVSECHNGHGSVLFNGDCPCCELIAELKHWREQNCTPTFSPGEIQ